MTKILVIEERTRLESGRWGAWRATEMITNPRIVAMGGGHSDNGAEVMQMRTAIYARTGLAPLSPADGAVQK